MDIEHVALAVIDALEAERIPHMLVGSFSSNFYGIPRMTQDADLVIELGDRSATCLTRHLPRREIPPLGP